jgi:succinoglycan biosynthesis protein ExoH
LPIERTSKKTFINHFNLAARRYNRARQDHSNGTDWIRNFKMEGISRRIQAGHGLTHLEISRAISLARILLIMGLVCVHFEQFPNSTVSPLAGLDIHNHPFVTWLDSTIRLTFYTVVPVLSMISGWLFFSFTEDAWGTIKRRMKKRFTSLYLPLLGWNTAYLIGLYTLWKFHPEYPLFDILQIKFATANLHNYLDAIGGFTHRPIGFQFWFVRDLFVTAMVSPVLWLMIRYAPWVGAAGLLVAWLCNSHLVIFCRTDVVFFFYLGALVRQKKLPMRIPMPLLIGITAFYVSWAAIRALAPYVVHFDGYTGPAWIEFLTRAMRMAGVVGAWGILYRLAQTKLGGNFGSRYGGVAFFLHAAHWPLLAILKIELWPLLPAQTGFWMLVYYFTCIALTISIGVGSGLMLAYKLPRVFAAMNGGRLLEQTVKSPTVP